MAEKPRTMPNEGKVEKSGPSLEQLSDRLRGANQHLTLQALLAQEVAEESARRYQKSAISITRC